MSQDEFSKKNEALKQRAFLLLNDWLMNKFDIKFRVTSTSRCPSCMVNLPPAKDPAGNDIHAAGVSKWAYNMCYDPKFKVVQYFEIWFSIDSPDPFVTLAHEALHGHHSKSGNHGYCGGDTTFEKEMELEEEAKLLVKEFRDTTKLPD